MPNEVELFMSEYLKIEQGKTYFITFTVVEWIDVFTRECYTNILIDSIKYCQQHKNLEVYAYVIMPNHVHMIASTNNSLSPILRDMKEHTSKKILEEVKNNPHESRKEWLLERFSKAGKGAGKHFRFWQPGNYPVELYSNKFILQKENYIHMNPVETGLVSKPEHYRLSSASEESPIKVLPIR